MDNCKVSSMEPFDTRPAEGFLFGFTAQSRLPHQRVCFSLPGSVFEIRISQLSNLLTGAEQIQEYLGDQDEYLCGQSALQRRSG